MIRWTVKLSLMAALAVAACGGGTADDDPAQNGRSTADGGGIQLGDLDHCSCEANADACDAGDCSQCPQGELASADGTTCEVPGLHCERDRNSCDCEPDDGATTWRCTIVP